MATDDDRSLLRPLPLDEPCKQLATRAGTAREQQIPTNAASVKSSYCNMVSVTTTCEGFAIALVSRLPARRGAVTDTQWPPRWRPCSLRFRRQSTRRQRISFHASRLESYSIRNADWPHVANREVAAVGKFPRRRGGAMRQRGNELDIKFSVLRTIAGGQQFVARFAGAAYRARRRFPLRGCSRIAGDTLLKGRQLRVQTEALKV
jgi:hypothetical protein